jgi:hypothetical protein
MIYRYFAHHSVMSGNFREIFPGVAALLNYLRPLELLFEREGGS